MRTEDFDLEQLAAEIGTEPPAPGAALPAGILVPDARPAGSERLWPSPPTTAGGARAGAAAAGQRAAAARRAAAAAGLAASGAGAAAELPGEDGGTAERTRG